MEEGGRLEVMEEEREEGIWAVVGIAIMIFGLVLLMELI